MTMPSARGAFLIGVMDDDGVGDNRGRCQTVMGVDVDGNIMRRHNLNHGFLSEGGQCVGVDSDEKRAGDPLRCAVTAYGFCDRGNMGFVETAIN